jgi:hypothetical protein
MKLYASSVVSRQSVDVAIHSGAAVVFYNEGYSICLIAFNISGS